MKPIVAIVGRPNVGKSTFFNRVTRSRDAIVDNFAGVTRDRISREASWNEVDFTLVDTGGFLDADADDISRQVRFQVRQAIDHADAVVLVLDGRGGVSPFDADLVGILRETGKPVFHAVNKIDGLDQEILLSDFYPLGIEDPYPISAEHGYGVPDLLDDLVKTLPASVEEPSEDLVRISVVGRPNVGKSSLINRLLNEERLLVSETPGTTRDAVDILCQREGRSYLLIDTAGIRRKGKVSEKLEKFSVIKALKSLERSDVALIVLDAAEGITDQDVSVAGYAHERGCGCILLLNKWDLVERDRRTARRYHEQLRESTKFLSFAPALNISASTGLRVGKILPLVNEVFGQYTARIGTGRLNRIIGDAVANNEPPFYRGRRIKLYYATQLSTKPPTFVVFTNYPEAIHFSYQRYLINRIREEAGLDKSPVRIFFRQRAGKKSGAPASRRQEAGKPPGWRRSRRE